MFFGIKNNLQVILFERDLTIKSLASKTGLAYSTVHGIVKGSKAGITFEQLYLICNALNADVGDLYEVAKEDNENPD